MLILQNQCNLRLPKYKESSTNIEFDHWKCIRIYQKAHMISEKKYPWLGLKATKLMTFEHGKI